MQQCFKSTLVTAVVTINGLPFDHFLYFLLTKPQFYSYIWWPCESRGHKGPILTGLSRAEWFHPLHSSDTGGQGNSEQWDKFCERRLYAPADKELRGEKQPFSPIPCSHSTCDTGICGNHLVTMWRADVRWQNWKKEKLFISILFFIASGLSCSTRDL